MTHVLALRGINKRVCVNVEDQLEVINGWGACTPSKVCRGDANLDCTVNVDDLLVVINGWCSTPCPDPVPACCQLCAQCGESFGGGESEPSDPPTIAELIAFVLAADIPEQTKEEIIAALLEL